MWFWGGDLCLDLGSAPSHTQKSHIQANTEYFLFPLLRKRDERMKNMTWVTSLPAFGSVLWSCQKLQECDVHKKKLCEDKQERDKSQTKMKEKQGKIRREVAGAGKGRNECRRRFTSHFSVSQKNYDGKHSKNTERLLAPNYKKMWDLMLWLLKLLLQWLTQ